ncbi:MAG: biotin/lipoyl-containing protein [Lachnospiraceae bacterium]
MKKYHVEVNGTPYEVKISEMTGDADEAKPASPAPVVSAPAKAAAGGGEEITSPMPGSIFKVNVKNGQTVNAGDVLFILEAMKMENEIMAPKDGTVTNVNVQEGASVEGGTLLCTIS